MKSDHPIRSDFEGRAVRAGIRGGYFGQREQSRGGRDDCLSQGVRGGNRLLKSGQKRTFGRDYRSDAHALNAKDNAQTMMI